MKNWFEWVHNLKDDLHFLKVYLRKLNLICIDGKEIFIIGMLICTSEKMTCAFAETWIARSISTTAYKTYMF